MFVTNIKLGKNVLENLNLQIEEGQIICIIGKNGSRKIDFFKFNFWSF